MNRRQQFYYDQLRQIAEDRGGRVLSDRYVRSRDKMEFQCKEGHKFMAFVGNVKKGSWCLACTKTSHEVCQERFYDIVRKRGGRALTQYVNTRTRVQLVCANNHIFDLAAGAVMYNNSWCEQCPRHCPIVEKEFYDCVAAMGGKVIGVYVDTMTKVTLECEKGHSWKVTPNSILRGTWCRTCFWKYDSMVATLDEITKQRGGSYEGKYINCRTSLSFKCAKGHTWITSAGTVIRGSWCPVCRCSHGEEAVRKVLTDAAIPFVPQFQHALLPTRKYDFAFVYNGQHYIIEFDGEQHFNYVPFFHKDENMFKFKQEIDRIKTYVAILSGYKVIRIDYSQIANVSLHILTALTVNQTLYLSTPELYNSWLIYAPINLELLKTECPSFSYW